MSHNAFDSIAMVDLKGQYQRLKPELDKAIQQVLDETQFIKGPQIKLFENALAQKLNAGYVVSCGNGTDALQLAFMALNLKPGDEVILPVFTYAATAEVIALLGLTPVWVDVEPDYFFIDTNRIQAKITSKTKAIVPVHLFGQTGNLSQLMEIAKAHKLFVVEDNAQSLGAFYQSKALGTFGEIGTTSFFPSKNLGCFGDGGALITQQEVLASSLRMIANHGQSVQYKHDKIGLNSRLDTLQAAVLQTKLPYLDQFTLNRNKAAAWYDSELKEHPLIRIPIRNPESTHVFHQYTICLGHLTMGNDELRAKRDLTKTLLAESGVPSMVYYPIPLHHQNAYRNVMNNMHDQFPVAERLSCSVLSLPMHTEMSEELVKKIARRLIRAVNQAFAS
ncbi:DegT/DnrJ/EryC1/StrS family aminotransferase [Bacteroidota bacterium]